MKLTSQYKTQEIIKILREEIDDYPSIIRCIITLNAHYYQGTSPVCGVITDCGFELKNRKGPGFSLIAKGRLAETDSGTDIEIDYSKPLFPDILGVIFFNRYELIGM
jgi:hypothetical protein